MSGHAIRQANSGFIHQTCVYRSDEDFLAMAAPFVEEGLALGESVLTVTTPANLEMLNDTLGERVDQVDYAETAYFGRRPPQRIAAFNHYWQRRAKVGDHVRILAEPVWAGRTDRDITAWKRMESSLNVVLSATNIWMICPYDARVLSKTIISDACRTHPAAMTGEEIRSNTEFVDPVTFVRQCDADPLADAPPNGGLTLPLDGNMSAVRRFVAEQATVRGLTGEPVTILLTAVNEVAAYLAEQGAEYATVRIWAPPGEIVCEVGVPAVKNAADPFAGFWPPTPQPQPDDALWVARQLCELVEIRSEGTGCTVRLHVPGPRFVESQQTAAFF